MSILSDVDIGTQRTIRAMLSFPRRLLESAHSAVRKGKVHDRLVVEEVLVQSTSLLPSLLSVHLITFHRVVHVASS